jgi:hypothetical protein
LVLAALSFGAACANAQNLDGLARSYGRGVHAYFSGNSFEAVSSLSQAIDGGSQDPRAYYFRALAHLRMGMSAAAESDFIMAASLEVRDTDGTYPVSRSLERIQGRDRQLLEAFRHKARAEAQIQQRAWQRQRYEDLDRREKDVLRRSAPLPLDSFAPPRANASSAPQAPDDSADAPPSATGGMTKSEAQDPFAAPAERAPTRAPATVRPVPPGEKVKAGTLGKLLTRVLGKALADENSTSPPQQEITADPFADDPLAEQPEADTVEAPEAEDATDPFAPENSDKPVPAEPSTPDATPAENETQQPADAQDDPFADP